MLPPRIKYYKQRFKVHYKYYIRDNIRLLSTIVNYKRIKNRHPIEEKSGQNLIKKEIGVFVHLYYHDLWSEIASCLNNLKNFDFDLYICLTSDKPLEELKKIQDHILSEFPNAYILVGENRGLDIAGFFKCFNYTLDRNYCYNKILKLHSKRRFRSGIATGDEWRNVLFNKLVGSPETIHHILNIFDMKPNVGMIGPRECLLSKTPRDIFEKRNVNANYIRYFLKRLHIRNDQLLFFAGSMFWVRGSIFYDVFKGNRIFPEEFEPFYRTDELKSHAMERVFANIVRDKGYFFDFV